MISLIHPSRGRPEKSLETIRKWRDKCEEYIKVFVSVDEDDPKLEHYKDIYQITGCIVGKNKSAVEAINRAAQVAFNTDNVNVVIVVSDDTDCPKDWHLSLHQATHGKYDFILKTQDGTQPWIITNPIMDRAYYNRFGYIYYPGYDHMFADTELTCVADITGRKITSDLKFIHNHYSVTKTAPDEVSKRADKTWDQGEKLFMERYKRNFDLPPDQIKGKIQDNGMIRWLQRKNR